MLTSTAIWDNRSTFHTATFDYDGLGERFGNRVVGIGESPYLDPDSVTRLEALQRGSVDGAEGNQKNGFEPSEMVSV